MARPATLQERYSAHEVARIQRAGEILALTFEAVGREIAPGITTHHLDEVIGKIIKSFGGRAAFMGYKVGRHRFRYNACLSVNNEVVHGLPGPRKLAEGDLLKADIGVEKDGYFADSAMTFEIGRIPAEAERLSRITRNALQAGIDICRPGNRIGDIGAAVQQVAESAGYSVVREFSGHGVGRNLHQDPEVPNTGKRGTGMPLLPGMVLAIEPMVNEGGQDVRTMADGWTVVTQDGLLSAHWEHTVVITESGARILTEK